MTDKKLGYEIDSNKRIELAKRAFEDAMKNPATKPASKYFVDKCSSESSGISPAGPGSD